MNRRSFTRGVIPAIGLLTGCLRGDDEGEDVLRPEARTISVIDRTCAPSVDQTATVDFHPDESSVRLRGTILSKSRCDEVSLSVFTSRNERSDDTAIITARTEKPQDRECNRCRTALGYVADLTFNRTPTTVRVEHAPRNASTKMIGVYDRG